MAGQDAREASMSLQDIRQAIDKVDREIFDCLVRRSQLIEAVGQVKAAQGGRLPVRPAREAEQMHRLAQWHGDSSIGFPYESLSAIWREIIGAAIAQQGGLRVVASPEAQMPARCYFGAAAYIQTAATPLELITLVEQAPAVMVMRPQELLANLAHMPEGVQCCMHLTLDNMPDCLILGVFDEALAGDTILAALALSDLEDDAHILAQDKTHALVEMSRLPEGINILGRYAKLPVNAREDS